MRYNLDIPTDDLSVANSPEIGGQSKVKLGYSEIGYIALISQEAPASGTYKGSTPAVDLGTGKDLVMVCDNGIKSPTDAVAITLSVVFDDDSSGTATATFAVPSFAKDQSKNLPIGLGVDVIPVGGGNLTKKIKTVNGITAFVGGVRGNRFQLLSLLEAAEYYDLGCARTKNETLPVPKSLPIPCGLKGSAFNVAGRSDAGQLELSALHFSYGDGLSRLNGHRGTVMVETYAEDRVLKERTVYAGYRPNPSTDRGDGDDEVIDKATGTFEFFIKFV